MQIFLLSQPKGQENSRISRIRLKITDAQMQKIPENMKEKRKSRTFAASRICMMGMCQKYTDKDLSPIFESTGIFLSGMTQSMARHSRAVNV